MGETYTVKTLAEKTGVPFYTVKYLLQCNKLKLVKKSAGHGFPNLFHPDSVQQVLDHVKKNEEWCFFAGYTEMKMMGEYYSEDIEEWLLGALLSKESVINKIPEIKPDHFYHEKNQTIFKEILLMIAKAEGKEMSMGYKVMSKLYDLSHDKAEG